MKIYAAKDYNDMSRKAGNLIAAQIIMKPDAVLGLATGSTPVGTYQCLTEWYKAGTLSFKTVRSVNLDEYVGLAPDHDQSYRYFMQSNLFGHVDINPANTRVPDGLTRDAKAFCDEYDAFIRAQGYVDLQLLGIGRNGHIGFNEPGSVFVRGTNCVQLTQSTIDANKRFFAREEDVPRKAYTMGIGGIMMARRVVLVACGEDKAEAVAKTVSGPITPEVPASILQLHRDFVLIADEAALSQLEK